MSIESFLLLKVLKLPSDIINQMLSKVVDLKVDPSIAVKQLSGQFTSGCRLKDKLCEEYHSDRAANQNRISGEHIEKYQEQAKLWTDETLQVILETFSTQRQAYLFRDASTNGLAYLGENADFSNMIVKFEARLSKLNYLIEFLFDHTNIEVVAQRDAYVQTGEKSQMEVKNGD